ncbi:winged helix-turn-helix domain-containing protein [Chloroflexales bacterium ZM16-3]|nr:winged helix-turn-helix domain-containing protein [Chloroflexales bacterium ZM16-3]
MMNLQEWLQHVGFLGNPFALKQADDEGEQLNEYFVAHPSYSAIIDSTIYRSSVLHAPRGSGKSSMRRMFEQHCRRDTVDPRPLVVSLTDWMPITAHHRGVTTTIISPETHFSELAKRVVVALAQVEHIPQRYTSLSPDLHGLIAWLCFTYGDYLIPAERRRLAGYGWLPEGSDVSPYAINRIPVARRVQLLADLVVALGFPGCYVLVDGVDEVLDTAGDWAAGANLIEALLANLAIIEAHQIAFKFFLPSEVVHEIQGRGRLRSDRIQVLAVRWSDELLRELLSRRLQAFSNGLITRLAQRNAPGNVEDTDSLIVQAAGGSPRALLNLSEALFQTCADHPDEHTMLIMSAHLSAAITSHTMLSPQPQPAQVAAVPAEQTEVPPLCIMPDGEIRFGTRLFERWTQITPLQRRFLDYLFANRHRLCSHKEVIEHVWAAEKKPADEDSLRKLVDRLTRILEPDPKNPQYFQKVPGYIRLIHTVD